MPPLPADSIHARACKLKCEKILTRPHPYIHILRCDSLQVVGELELNTDPLQAVPQDLSNRIKVSGQLVHIGGCCVPQIVKADMGHLCVTQQLPKIRGDPCVHRSAKSARPAKLSSGSA